MKNTQKLYNRIYRMSEMSDRCFTDQSWSTAGGTVVAFLQYAVEVVRFLRSGGTKFDIQLVTEKVQADRLNEFLDAKKGGNA